MLRLSLAVAAAVTLFAPDPAPAQDLQLRDRFDIPVYPIDANSFEVVENDGAGGTQLWCAAGTYVREVLRQRRGSIYILEARGDSRAEPGRKSVIFTTQPTDNAFYSVSQGVRRSGKTFTAVHAYALCGDTPQLHIIVDGERF